MSAVSKFGSLARLSTTVGNALSQEGALSLLTSICPLRKRPDVVALSILGKIMAQFQPPSKGSEESSETIVSLSLPDSDEPLYKT